MSLTKINFHEVTVKRLVISSYAGFVSMKTFCRINEGTSYAAHWLISILATPQSSDSDMWPVSIR